MKHPASCDTGVCSSKPPRCSNLMVVSAFLTVPSGLKANEIWVQRYLVITISNKIRCNVTKVWVGPGCRLLSGVGSASSPDFFFIYSIDTIWCIFHRLRKMGVMVPLYAQRLYLFSINLFIYLLFARNHQCDNHM